MGASVSNTGQVDPGIRPNPKSSGSPAATVTCSALALAFVIFTPS